MFGAGRLTVVLAIYLLIAASVHGAEQDDGRSEAAKPKKSTTGAMLRSLAVPGWGQLYNEQYLKALVFAGVEGTQLIQISRAHDRMMGAKRVDFHPEQYEDGSDAQIAALAANSRADFEEQRFRERRNKTLWWFTATLLLALGDAYVDAHLFGLDFSPELSYERAPVWGLAATVRF